MNSSCIGGCLDAQSPVKVSFVKLRQWAEADAEFLKKVSVSEKRETGSPPTHNERQVYHEWYVYRQNYLRSYTFCKKETVAEKTKKWLKDTQKVKNKPKRGEKTKKRLKDAQKVKNKPNRSSGSGFCPFLQGVFKSLIFCVAQVDVHEQ